VGLIGLAIRNIATSSGLDAFLRVGANTTYAGISVTPETALQIAAVFGCTRVIAEDIGKLPFEVYQQTADRERQRATTSPLWKLIHDRPNAYQTSQQFREYLTACALLRGNGFALKNVIQGQVRELLPLSPDRVNVVQLPDFEIVFDVTMDNGRIERLTKRDVFVLPGLTINGAFGVSVVQYARQTLGTITGANRHAGTFFGNGAKPSGMLNHPGKLSDQAAKRLKNDLYEATAGAASNNTLVLEEGMKFEPVTMTNTDSQFLESRVFEVVEICRWFRVPPHKVAELSRATFSNIEHQAIEYVTDTLMPWGKRWEYAINGQVIVTNALYAELNFNALLRGTTKERYEAYLMATGGPWMSGNQVRKLENMEPMPELDKVLRPLNYAPAGQAEQEASGEQAN